MPTKETVRKDGGLVTSTARSARSRRQQCRWQASNRNVGQRPFVLLRGPSSFNRGWRSRGGSRRFVACGSRPCACTVGRSSEVPTFLRVVLTIVSLRQKSDERRHRRGSAQNPGDRAASGSETQPGVTPRRRDRRPADGRRSGSSDAWVLSRDVREKVVSTVRSQAPPLPRKGGPPLARAKRAGGVR